MDCRECVTQFNILLLAVTLMNLQLNSQKQTDRCFFGKQTSIRNRYSFKKFHPRTLLINLSFFLRFMGKYRVAHLSLQNMRIYIKLDQIQLIYADLISRISNYYEN